MAIQKQVTREEQITKQGNGLGVSLNSVRKPETKSLSQNERNASEITAYAHDIRKSLLIGGLVIAIEIALYFFRVIK